jgi:hypothetical protein
MFEPGNKEWEKRQSTKPKAIPTPERMFELFTQYCKEVDDNPWVKTDFRGKDATPVKMKYKAPYTWNGFDNFLFKENVCGNLDDYRSNKHKAYDAFIPVFARIGKIISDEKMVGATLGFYNHNIIAAELGLASKREISATTTILNLGSGVDPNALPPAAEDIHLPDHEYTPYENIEDDPLA